MYAVAFTVTPPVGGEGFPAPNSIAWCDLVLASASKRRAEAREKGDSLVVEIMDGVITGVLDRRIEAAANAVLEERFESA
ncbi:MAG: hypothetical protein NVSMB4_04210 [Acidimicrobiales bacterium]